MAKQMPKSIKDMVASDMMQAVINYDTPYEMVEQIAEQTIDSWGFDLFTRKPKPALVENGVLKPTDLDLASFMSALSDRGAVIVLPKYTSRRAKTIREGERVVSNKNRTGKILGLSANKDVFSFSVKIEDSNVIQAGNEEEQDKVGAPRAFMLTDLDGSWWDGWSKIEFMPSAKENEFLKDKKLWTGMTVVFKNFVHPNRWASFYGQYYFLTKCLIERLTEQAAFFRSEKKRLIAKGVKFPKSGDGKKKEWPKSTKGKSKSEKFTAFECEIDAPWTGELTELPDTQESLVLADKAARRLSYSLVPKLRFAARATELAFFNAGMDEKGFPSWIKGAEWEDGYVVKGKRTKWKRLVLAQLLPGQTGFALRFRTYEKSEQVAA